MRRRRALTGEERRLWAEVLRSVTPLQGRTPPAPEVAPQVPALPPSDAVPESRAAPATARPADQGRLPPLAPLERRQSRALARGRTRAESVLDLHGLTQAEAHSRLIGFLRRAQAAGHNLVLVITGQGRGDALRDRGVLRRLVPLWLSLPELRGVVLGFEEAGPRQGGAGALYVRLRRRRPSPG